MIAIKLFFISGMLIPVVYILMYLFGFGVLWFARGLANNQIIGHIGAWMIITIGVTTIGTVIFPQDAEGAPQTTTGQLH